MIRKGDIVTIKAQWREPGEEAFTYVARNDEEDGRFDMSALEQGDWALWPMQVTAATMVEKTGERLLPDGSITNWSESSLAETLGDRFAATLKEWLTPKEFEEMKRRNETDSHYANLNCASHDFCDANMAMDIAWRELIGTEIDADDERQATVWNAAWESARLYHIGHQKESLP